MRYMKNIRVAKTIFVITLIFFSACSKEEIAKKFSPLYPNKYETHILELYKVQISDHDFNLSSFGNPLLLEIKILENGNIIKQKLLNGKRGERKLKNPVQWVINFNPKNNYQLVLSESAVIADTYIYKFPATPKIGMWPFIINNGIIKIGIDSKLYFRDKVAN